VIWPPTLADLKRDLSLTDTRDDTTLTACLDAAVTFVMRVRADVGDKNGDIALGTVRLAGRWFIRRRSPDGLLAMADLGAARIPSFDPDIERLLGIGRYRGSVIA